MRIQRISKSNLLIDVRLLIGLNSGKTINYKMVL